MIEFINHLHLSIITSIWWTFLTGIGGIFFAAFPVSNMISEQQQQQFQLNIQNQAELENLIQYLGSIGFIIGAIVLAVGIGYLVSTTITMLSRRYFMNNGNSSNVFLDSSEEFHCYPSFPVVVESIIFVFSYRKRLYISFSTGGTLCKSGI